MTLKIIQINQINGQFALKLHEAQKTSEENFLLGFVKILCDKILSNGFVS